jgi:hypothetical protein
MEVTSVVRVYMSEVRPRLRRHSQNGEGSTLTRGSCLPKADSAGQLRLARISHARPAATPETSLSPLLRSERLLDVVPLRLRCFVLLAPWIQSGLRRLATNACEMRASELLGRSSPRRPQSL